MFYSMPDKKIKIKYKVSKKVVADIEILKEHLLRIKDGVVLLTQLQKFLKICKTLKNPYHLKYCFMDEEISSEIWGTLFKITGLVRDGGLFGTRF